MKANTKIPKVANLFATAQKGKFGQENEHENGELRETEIPNLSAVFCLNYIFSTTCNNMQITNQKNHVIATARYEAGSNPEIRLNHDFNMIYKICMIFKKKLSTEKNVIE